MPSRASPSAHHPAACQQWLWPWGPCCSWLGLACHGGPAQHEVADPRRPTSGSCARASSSPTPTSTRRSSSGRATSRTHSVSGAQGVQWLAASCRHGQAGLRSGEHVLAGVGVGGGGGPPRPQGVSGMQAACARPRPALLSSSSCGAAPTPLLQTSISSASRSTPPSAGRCSAGSRCLRRGETTALEWCVAPADVCHAGPVGLLGRAVSSRRRGDGCCSKHGSPHVCT
jgi:hypothetical protein